MKSMEDDIDIYGDLPDFGAEFSKNFASNNEENTAEKQVELKKQVTELTAKLENSQTANKSLEINLFSLLKTAKAEIARKDKMIDELRKRLDDATFGRSSYSNDYVSRKSTFCRTVANTRQKSIDICFSVNEKSTETSSVPSSLSSQSKDQQNKCTLVPITVFGERLLKRMTDEQNLEKKDKSNKSMTNVSDNDDKNNAGYTVESDKENGFSRDATIDNDFDNDNGKEMQKPSAIARRKGSENLSAGSTESTTTDLRSNDENETSCRFATYTGKRRAADEEGNGHVDAKRIKSSGERESCFEATKKETITTDNNVGFESKEKSSELPRYCNDFGFSDFCSKEKGIRDKKYSDYARTSSNVEPSKKHGCSMVHDANKADERRETKSKGDKRDTINDRSSKRREKSAQSSTSISEKKDTSYRCVEVLYEKDSHRHGYHSEHRSGRDKQREHRRTDDHRSRAKSTSYATKLYSREEKYHRSRCNKNSDHDGGSKFEERNCNFRNNGAASKWKICKNDSYNDGQTKRSTIDRTSTDQRFDEMKKAQCRQTNEHESRKIRNITEKSMKRHDESSKQDEHGSEHGLRSRRDFDAENLISKEIDGKRNGVTTTTQTANAVEIGNESRKYAEKQSKNPSTNLADFAEISDSGNKNSSKDNETTCCDVEPPEDDPSPNAANDASIKRGTAKNETQRWKASSRDDVPRILRTNVARCLPGEKISKNIESVENIENIEKFIRSCVFVRDKNVLGTNASDANASIDNNNSQSGSREKEEVEMQGNANAATASSSENLQTDKNVTDDNVVATSNEKNSVKDNGRVVIAETRENEHVVGSISSVSSELAPTNADRSVDDPTTTKVKMSGTESNAKNTAGAADFIITDDIRNNCRNVIINRRRDEDKINRNDLEDVTSTTTRTEHDDESGNGNNIAMEMPTTLRGKERDKARVGKTEEKTELTVLEEPLEKSTNRSNDSNSNSGSGSSSRKDSMNVYGKIVVFARRKKPVCLADSNANMTVLIDNNNKRDDTGVDLSIADIGKISG